jgi:hypothetical protein
LEGLRPSSNSIKVVQIGCGPGFVLCVVFHSVLGKVDQADD